MESVKVLKSLLLKTLRENLKKHIKNYKLDEWPWKKEFLRNTMSYLKK